MITISPHDDNTKAGMRTAEIIVSPQMVVYDRNGCLRCAQRTGHLPGLGRPIRSELRSQRIPSSEPLSTITNLFQVFKISQPSLGRT
ncbi:Cutinase [Fusarium oxysporum f. sp. albedinis]|nr:Cutinase [Fusarium oxysporum f. sp. albedinis]